MIPYPDELLNQSTDNFINVSLTSFSDGAVGLSDGFSTLLEIFLFTIRRPPPPPSRGAKGSGPESGLDFCGSVVLFHQRRSDEACILWYITPTSQWFRFEYIDGKNYAFEEFYVFRSWQALRNMFNGCRYYFGHSHHFFTFHRTEI